MDSGSHSHQTQSLSPLYLISDNALNPSKCSAACGDGPDEERAAAHFSIPFKRILSPTDLYSVPGLLRSDLAMEIPEGPPHRNCGPSDVEENSAAHLKMKADRDVLAGCNKQLFAYYTNDALHADQGARLSGERAALIGQPT